MMSCFKGISLPFFREVVNSSIAVWKSHMKHLYIFIYLYMNSYSGRVILRLPRISMFFSSARMIKSAFRFFFFRKICYSMKFCFTAAVITYNGNTLIREDL